MTNKKEVEVIAKPLAVPKEDTLVLAGDPQKQMEYAIKSSQMLIQVLAHKPKKVMINGEQYLEFEDWQTLGRFYGATVGVEWTKPIMKGDKVWGYEAKAIVYIKGEVVSSAEAMTTRDEKNWSNRDEFTLRSMAQTRASAKALRNVLAWVAVLGGFKPTPLEDMPDSPELKRTYVVNKPAPETKIPDARNKAQKILDEDASKERAGIVFRSVEESHAIRNAKELLNTPDIQMEEDNVPLPEPQGEDENISHEEVNPWNRPMATVQGECSVEGCSAIITDKVRDYSKQKFGKVLCYNHQKSN